MKKRIVLCADDYGQAPEISKGIISLLEQQRLSATSCMANTDCWPEHAEWLKPFKGKADIGLHFNLTEGQALSKQLISVQGRDLMPLSTVLKQAFLRLLDQSALEAECHAQLDRFVEIMGFLPDFIDGHQHVHQFPVVRFALINVYQQRLATNKSYVRLVNERIQIRDFFHDIKKIVIRLTGTRALKHLLDKHKIPYNQTFAGIYEFQQAQYYSDMFPCFLQRIEDRGLIMCHPGLQPVADDEGGGNDLIAKARFEEYQYFIAGQFIADCERFGVVLSRFTPA